MFVINLIIKKIRKKRFKLKKPKFRGSFGSKRKRKISKKKWKKWRKPRGMDSDLRRKLKNEGKQPSIGYRKPRRVRRLHPSGYKEFLVKNLEDIKKIMEREKNFVLRVASTVGKKKRKEIVDFAGEEKIKIVNIGKIRKEMKKIEGKEEKNKKRESKKIKNEKTKKG